MRHEPGYWIRRSRDLEQENAQLREAVEMHRDAVGDVVSDLRDQQKRFAKFEANHAAYQAIVADALLWFQGFKAAFALKEDWERPSVPDVAKLRELNGALQDLGPLTESEIPF